MDLDRVEAMIWGALMGSALGLPARHRDTEQLATTLTPEKMAFPRDNQTREGRHPPNAWAAILEQAFVVGSALNAHKEILAKAAQSPNQIADRASVSKFLKTFAEMLLEWAQDGFRAWQDHTTPYEVDFQIAQSVKLPKFAEDPTRATQAAEELHQNCGILPRMLLVAALPTPGHTEQIAATLCATTHKTTLCQGASVFSALLLRCLLLGHPPTPEGMRFPLQRLKSYLPAGAFSRLLKYLARPSELAAVGDRDHGGRIQSTLYCMVSTYRKLSALRHKGPLDPTTFTQIISDTARAGGTADINCAMVGALLGAAGGAEAIPPGREHLPQYGWLCRQVGEFRSLLAVPQA